MCCYMLLQNVSLFCSFVTLFGVNSSKNIRFCFNCGMSVGDPFSRDSLDSSLCAMGKSYNASELCMSFSILGAILISFTSSGV